MIRTESTSRGPSLRRVLGMSMSTVILLAAIAAIRVPLHDLGIVNEGGAAWSLVFGPLVLWVGVVLVRGVPNPLLTLTAVGLVYGIMLAAIHQVLWGAAFGGDLPGLGGNLEGVLTPGLESRIFRAASIPSSLVTGAVLGAVAGAVAWAIGRVADLTRRTKKSIS